tara:strand:- start:6273 stop:6653 length:381 start_codon:yes stop_codon:yes gene_type:complete
MQTHQARQKALRGLFVAGLLTRKQYTTLSNKSIKIEKQLLKDTRQDEVNAHVETHLLSITPGELFKHRAVWDAVGRDKFTRDEISKALNHHKENFLVEQVRKGPNNFQVFWQRTKMKLNCIIEIVD